MTSSPWRQQSSPVLTTTVSVIADVRLQPVRQLRPADPAGERDDPGHALRRSMHLADPVERLGVVGEGVSMRT